MARPLKAKIRIEADTKNADKGIQSVTSSFASMASGVLAGAAAFAAFTKGIKAAISVAIIQQQAIAQLDNQLRSLGPAADEVSAALQRQASQLQAVSTFGDETIIKSQAIIAQFTKEQSQVEALTKATIDFAAAKGVDLAVAADLVAKSFGSSTNALSRYGVQVEGAAGSTERLQQLTQGLANLFGGAALAEANTFGGQLKSLTNNLFDTAENVGELVTENEFLIVALKEANAALAAHNAEADKAPGIWNAFKRAIDGFQFSQLGATRGTRAFRLGQELLDKAAKGATDAIEDETEAVDGLTDALDKVDPAIEATLKALEKFIVTDQQVNKELQENADLLAATEILYDRGFVSRQKLEEAEAAIASRARELNGELENQAEALEITETSTLSYSEALRIARLDLDQLTEAEIRNADQTVSASERRAAARTTERGANLLGGESEFAQTGGGTFFIPEGVFIGQNGRVSFIGSGAGAGGIIGVN